MKKKGKEVKGTGSTSHMYYKTGNKNSQGHVQEHANGPMEHDGKLRSMEMWYMMKEESQNREVVDFSVGNTENSNWNLFVTLFIKENSR